MAADRRRWKFFWRVVAVLLIAGIALAVVAALFPVQLFGTSRRSLEYSLERKISGHAIFADCSRRTGERWECELFDGQTSTTSLYDVQLSKEGCWTATAEAEGVRPQHACLDIWDYVRIMDR